MIETSYVIFCAVNSLDLFWVEDWLNFCRLKCQEWSALCIVYSITLFGSTTSADIWSSSNSKGIIESVALL